MSKLSLYSNDFSACDYIQKEKEDCTGSCHLREKNEMNITIIIIIISIETMRDQIRERGRDREHTSSSSLKCIAVGITQVQHKLGVRQQGSIGVHIRHAELQSGLGSSADGGIESQKSADGQCRGHGGGECILLSGSGGGIHHMLMTSSVESMQLLDQNTA